MKVLDMTTMKNLSFPDFDVEKVELSLTNRVLKIFVEGGWLDIDGGILLNKGVLCFSAWESFSMHKFNANTQKWSPMHETVLDPLRDICEMNFLDSTVCLYGFSKQTGDWIEWKIQNARIHAEFED